MKTPTKDLFDDSTMSFGEHLEVLRTHLIRAIFGLVVAAVICLYKGDLIVNFIRAPIDRALRRYTEIEVQDDTGQMSQGWKKFREDMGLNTLTELFTGTPAEKTMAEKVAAEKAAQASGESEVEPGAEPGVIEHSDLITVRVRMDDLAQALHAADPERFPVVTSSKDADSKDTSSKDVDSKDASSKDADSKDAEQPIPAEKVAQQDGNSDQTQTPPSGEGTKTKSKPAPPTVALTLQAPEFAQFQQTVELSRQAVTLNVQEAFMTYLKVSLVAALILSSPWIFFQLWQFVAAGLYPHERKYVYLYGGMSLALFFAGALFCFYAVFPFVLNFLLSFNKSLEITPQIRLSEWISFAVVLPLMFGISFQLPLVMLFLERISIFQVSVYREQRRMAILVIAILSSILTPADPMSMLLMMFPLVFLYELGIRLCVWLPKPSPFDEEFV